MSQYYDFFSEDIFKLMTTHLKSEHTASKILENDYI